MATEVDLNRWREAGKEIGRKIGVVEERERIIKLLKSKRCECLDLEKDEFVALAKKDGLLKHANCDWVGLDWVIAFIKGENK